MPDAPIYRMEVVKTLYSEEADTLFVYLWVDEAQQLKIWPIPRSSCVKNGKPGVSVADLKKTADMMMGCKVTLLDEGGFIASSSTPVETSQYADVLRGMTSDMMGKSVEVMTGNEYLMSKMAAQLRGRNDNG